MFQEIDLVLCDSDLKVVAQYENFHKNKILWPISKAYYVFELPLGSARNIRIGHQLKLEDSGLLKKDKN